MRLFLDLSVMAKIITVLLLTALVSASAVSGVVFYLMARHFSWLDAGYVTATRDSLIAGTAVALLLALLVGLMLGIHMRQRLNRLTSAVKAMKQGDLSQHVTVDARDELGQLAGEFNRMSDALATNYHHLQESRDQIQRQVEQLRRLSVRDALTNLYNRRYFDEQGALLFERAVRYNRPLTVMIGDIDHFKSVNDTLSHAMGDEVLRQIAEILSSKVRAADMVARYGGEEFVVAFPETTLPQAITTCDMLRGRIESFDWGKLHPGLKITISMGLCADTLVKDIHAMVEVADSYLYKAKQSGRNRVCAPRH